MTGKNILVAAIILLAPSVVNAENQLDEIAAEIAANNSELKASRARSMADRSELRMANNLQDPDIEVAPRFGAPGTKVEVEASQSFDWPGVYIARSNAASASSRALDYLDEAKELEIKQSIKATLIDIINYKRRVAIFRTTLEHIDSLMSAIEKAAASNDVSRLDLNKLRIERLLVNRRLNDVALQLSSSISDLQAMNGGMPCHRYVDRLTDFPSEPLLPVSTYIDAAEQNDPSLKYASARQNAANLNKKVLSRSKLPGVTLGYLYEYELGDHFNGFKIGFTLPIFSNRHKAAQLNAEILALQVEQSQLDISTKTEIMTAYNHIVRIDKEIEQYNAALGDNDNLRLLSVAYSARHISLLEYLQDYIYFLDAQEQLIELRYQRALLLSRLTRYL